MLVDQKTNYVLEAKNVCDINVNETMKIVYMDPKKFIGVHSGS